MAFLENLGNLFSGRGYRSNQEVLAEQEQKMAEQAQNEYTSALKATDWNNLTPEQAYIRMAEIDPANSSAWTENMLSMKGQQYLRDTSLQSTMKQLKEAGINPLLAVTKGIEASTGANSATGQVAQTETTRSGNQATVKQQYLNTILDFVASMYGSTVNAVAKLAGGK